MYAYPLLSSAVLFSQFSSGDRQFFVQSFYIIDSRSSDLLVVFVIVTVFIIDNDLTLPLG